EITFDLPTVSEGDDLPSGGGGYNSSDLDLAALGFEDGETLDAPAGFTLSVSGEQLAYSRSGAEIVEAHGYAGTLEHVVTSATGATIAITFSWDWSALEPAPEEDEDGGDESGEVVAEVDIDLGSGELPGTISVSTPFDHEGY